MAIDWVWDNTHYVHIFNNRQDGGQYQRKRVADVYFPGHTEAGVPNALIAANAPKMMNLLIDLLEETKDVLGDDHPLITEGRELISNIVKEHMK